MTAIAAEALILLIAKYGVPAAQGIYATIAKAREEGRDPTDDEWDALEKLTAHTIAERLTEPAP